MENTKVIEGQCRKPRETNQDWGTGTGAQEMHRRKQINQQAVREQHKHQYELN